MYGQESKTDVEYYKDVDAKVTSLKYSSNSIKELESIDWTDVKSIFETNKAEEKIELSFELDLKESKNKFKGSVTVGGETKNIDSVIKKSRKILKGLIRMSKNYENN